jgi:hypothetical protein
VDFSARIIKSEGFSEASDLKIGFKKMEHNDIDVVLVMSNFLMVMALILYKKLN